MLLPGTIFAVKGPGSGPMKWILKLQNLLINPPCDECHYGLILLCYKGDYVILESIEKGIAIGRLSFYDMKNLRFYWPSGATTEDGKKAAWELTKYGRCPYDFLLIGKLFIQGILLLLKHPWHKIKVEELSWTADSAFICSEAAIWPWYQVGYDVLQGLAEIPSGIRKAVIEGRLQEIN